VAAGTFRKACFFGTLGAVWVHSGAAKTGGGSFDAQGQIARRFLEGEKGT